MSRREDIDNAVWGDPTFEELSPDAKLLYLWSFTNPLCNMAGLYKVSGQRMQRETGLPVQRWEKALAELTAADLVVVDGVLLWVRSRVKHLRSTSPNMARSIAGVVSQLDSAARLRARFLAAYGGLPWLEEVLAPLLAESEPFRDPPQTVVEESPNGSPDPSVDDFRSTKPEPGTVWQGLVEGSRTLQGRAGQGVVSPTTPSKDKTITPAHDRLPDDFPPHLASVADEVLAVLRRIQAERGGAVPTLRAVALALRALPHRDHLAVAQDLEHWALAGRGGQIPTKDWPGRYRNFLKREPDSSPNRPVRGALPKNAMALQVIRGMKEAV